MKMLPKGANAPLATSGTVHVELRWNPAQGRLDAVHFAVTADGRVPRDDWLLFSGRKEAPGRAARLSASAPGRCAFILQLELLPPEVQRCVFAATLESGRFGDLTGARITADAVAGGQVGFELTGAGDEQSLIFAEIYRYQDAWKLRAVGQGFRGGLEALAEHFGVAVVPDPVPSPPDPPAPAAERDRTQGAAPSRRTGGLLVKLLILLLLLLGGGGVALWQLYPSALEEAGAFIGSIKSRLQSLGPETTAEDAAATESRGPAAPAPYEQPTCAWTTDEVFERYHALGESYVRIIKHVDQSNELLRRLRQDLTASDTECPPSFRENSQREIERLGQLPVQAWKEEATQLNICAGLLIKRTDAELDQESRPIIIQRLVHEADRFRNLESDLTNISRDLAYLHNKAERLIEGFTDNLDACP